MKKYHVATGDGKSYYGIGYESYLQATEVLKISQSHDPQAHIVEEEYYFTNADCIRAMSDEELAVFLLNFFVEHMDLNGIPHEEVTESDRIELLRQLKQPAEERA